ncbi:MULTISPECIES: hypothetical protein [Bradyrhizobium]|uniref:hypothetical protein n=1 Tax=Bradyrhizobium TaxID=374 RepID=UPI00040ABAA0|nr:MULTISPECIES: hypothetical protein [Bradyrhizobium]UFW51297.1 hypothetical protein BaraCB756_09995 [Bradyrhizobium arachidis]
MIKEAIASGGASNATIFFPRLATEFRDETLDVDTIVGDADFVTDRFAFLAHAERTTEEDMLDSLRRHSERNSTLTFLAVQSAVRDRDV